MAEIRTTKHLTYAETGGNALAVTQHLTYAEMGITQARVTQVVAYAELGVSQMRATQLLVYAEYGRVQRRRVHGRNRVRVIYDGHDLTPFLNMASLAALAPSIEATHFANRTVVTRPGPLGWTLTVAGVWSPTMDGWIAPDVVEPPAQLKSLYVEIGGVLGSTPTPGRVEYLWTNQAFVLRYTAKSEDANGVIRWEGTLFGSGAPRRRFLEP